MCFEKLGVMVDCSRNGVMTPEAVERFIDLIRGFGYNFLMLYTEDTYEIPGQPLFGHMRGRYTAGEIRRLDDYAAARGVELIPCIQTLAHLNGLMHWGAYHPIRDTGDILLAEEEGTYALIEDMFRTLSGLYRSRTVHIGMDEAHRIGLGQYLARHGYRDRVEILLSHLNRVSELAAKYGLEPIMWGDMFFRLATGGDYYSEADPNGEQMARIAARIPKNIRLVYWDYYSADGERYRRNLTAHEALKGGAWFAGGAWSWGGFAPHNTFSLGATRPAMEACRACGVKNAFITLWGDNGGECSRFALLPTLFAAASFAKGKTDMEGIKREFEEKTGIPYEAMLLLDLPGTPNESEQVVNAEKYLLYNDPFFGEFDSTLRPGDAASFAACSEKLARWENHPAYGHLFKTQRALCRVLELKCDLGVRTRAAYQKGDRAALLTIAEEYEEVRRRLQAFYKAFLHRWEGENKPQGFEVQDARLGGLDRRLAHCGRVLTEYARGERLCIPELEEPPLPVHGDGPCYHNDWASNVTANCI